MQENKDYSKLTLEELLKEEQEMKTEVKKKKTITAVLIGFLVGVLIYGIATKGIGFLHILLPVILIGGIYKNSQKEEKQLELIQAEIKAKK